MVKILVFGRLAISILRPNNNVILKEVRLNLFNEQRYQVRSYPFEDSNRKRWERVYTMDMWDTKTRQQIQRKTIIYYLPTLVSKF